jgi:hypothetical protein
MPKTLVSGTAQVSVPTAPERVWERMKDYGDLSWTEGVAETRVSGQGIGMVRSVRLEGSEDWMDEVLLAIDDTGRKFDYGIDTGMAGVENYRASGQAIPEGDGCAIRWQCSGEVDAGQAEDMQVLMDVMAGEIARLFAAQFE